MQLFHNNSGIFSFNKNNSTLNHNLGSAELYSGTIGKTRRRCNLTIIMDTITVNLFHNTMPAFTFSKSIMETPAQCVKCVAIKTLERRQ